MSSSNPLISTKLYVPRPRADIVPRPRLAEKLELGLRGKVTLVSAPAGYGKTTFLSAWAQQADHPVIWLSLDEHDNDFPQFLRYLITAVQQIDGRIGIEILDALNTSQTPQSEILLTLLINDIAAYDKQFILVLDDCHEITNIEVFEALEFLIFHQPAELHIIFLGRVDPSVTLSRLRVEGELMEIRSADLRFTNMETTAFLNDSMNLDLTIDEIISLENSSEGWIAGLQLAGLSLHQREDRSEFILAFSGVHHHLLDYLMDEVLSQQSNEIRDFLFQTSVLDRFNSSLCNSILEIDNSLQIIQELDDSNLFIIPLNDERSWFRYHHLFRDFLELCLHEDRPEKIPGLHKRAAKWYAEHDFDSQAFDHMLVAEDFETAARFVESKAKVMLERSELAKVMQWVAAIPSEDLNQRPRLGIYHAWAMRLSGSPYDVVESEIQKITQDLEASTSDLLRLEPGSLHNQPEDEIRNLKAHLFALQAFQGVYSENPKMAIEMAEKAKTYRPDENFVLSSLGFALGWAYRISGDLSAAYTAFIGSSELSMQSGNNYMAVTTLCRGAYSQVLKGLLHKGEEDFKQSLKLAVSQDNHQIPVAGYAYVYLSGIDYEWNNLDLAKQYALEGIQLCERVGLIMDQVVGYSFLARVYLAQGDAESAMDACQSAKELSLLMKDYVYTRRWAEDCQVRLWIYQDNFEQLEQWVSSSDLRIEDHPNFKRDIDHIILARALVKLGKYRSNSSYMYDGINLLIRLEKFSRDRKWDGKLIEILVLLSRAMLISNNEVQALEYFEKAISLAEPEGYIRTFIDGGKSTQYLLQKIPRNSTNRDYVQKLLASFGSDQVSNQGNVPQLQVEPLSTREMDVLRMLATDQTGPDIAKEMHIALSTLRFHTRNIYSKMMVNNRRSAVRKARESQLI